MKNKLIVTFNENETNLSDLERGLKILKNFPIKTVESIAKGQEGKQDLEVYLKNAQNREYEIHPQIQDVNYLDLDKIKDSDIDFERDHVKVSTRTNEGRYNFSFYSQKIN